MYQPTDEELLGAPDKVLYERHMFFGSLNAFLNLQENKELYEEGTWTQEDDDLYNATLEASLLHARNLLDFFIEDPTKKDDIRAAHFLRDPKWKSTKLALLNSRRGDINYGLSHLTYRRVTNAKPDWNDLLKIADDEVNAAFDEFISLLPKNEQSRWEPARTRQKIYKREETSVNTQRNSRPPITTATPNYILSSNKATVESFRRFPYNGLSCMAFTHLVTMKISQA